MPYLASTARGLALALAVPTAVLLAGPAHAADGLNVICVGAPADVVCDSNVASIQLAGQTAFNAAGDDLIAIGSGTFSAFGATLQSNAEGTLSLQGRGEGTVITMPSDPAIQSYLWTIDAEVRDLRIEMAGGADSSSDIGLRLTGGSARNVTVHGPTTQNATGINATNASVDDASVELAGASGRGLVMAGDALATDVSITANTGLVAGADSGVQRLSRARMGVCSAGVTVSAGEVSVDNSVIDLGSCGGQALRAGNSNEGASSALITADHLTIVGGGSNSRGLSVVAALPAGRKSSTVLLSNSVIDGPEAAMVLWAGNDGNQGGASEAFIGVSHSAYDPAKAFSQIDANGTGGISVGAGNTAAAPEFADAAAKDFRPAPGSPLVDAGSPAAGQPALDVVGNPRVADGNGDITARRDIGAYEVPDTFAAQTSAVSGAALTRDRTPTFTFSSEAGATFTCKVDAKPATACTSPYTAPSLTEGSHQLVVTATDATGNADPSPASRPFVVDTVAPSTRFVSKPGAKIRKKSARFTFAAPGAVRFQCRLDARAWVPCARTKVVTVKKGKHVFRVRGIDAVGNVDLTPSVHRFRRV